MIKIKSMMENVGFSYENPTELEQSEFYFALEDYKKDFQNFSSLDEEEQTENLKSSLEAKEQNLIQIFSETVTAEPDPEIEELKEKEEEANKRAEREEKLRLEAEEQAEREREAYELEKAEAKRINDEREEKLNKILEKQKLVNDEKIFLLNNKRKLSYPELQKVGIDIENAPRKFEWNGYIFEKQWMFKQYVILSRPK